MLTVLPAYRGFSYPNNIWSEKITKLYNENLKQHKTNPQILSILH